MFALASSFNPGVREDLEMILSSGIDTAIIYQQMIKILNIVRLSTYLVLTRNVDNYHTSNKWFPLPTGDISDSTESAVVAFPKPPPPRVFPKMPSRYPTTPKTPYSATLVTPSLATPGTITAPGTPADIVVLR